MRNVDYLDNLKVIHVQWSDFELKVSLLNISLFNFVDILFDILLFLNIIEAQFVCHYLIFLTLRLLETDLAVIEIFFFFNLLEGHEQFFSHKSALVNDN